MGGPCTSGRATRYVQSLEGWGGGGGGGGGGGVSLNQWSSYQVREKGLRSRNIPYKYFMAIYILGKSSVILLLYSVCKIESLTSEK